VISVVKFASFDRVLLPPPHPSRGNMGRSSQFKGGGQNKFD
jgi:hypothetical protein